MNEFTTATDVTQAMKADLLNKSFPELLTALATVSKKHLDKALIEECEKAGIEVPVVDDPRVYQFPPKATLIVAGTADKESADRINEAVANFYEMNLSDKAKLLKMLNEGGIR